MSVLERFLNYVKFDTMSDSNSTTCPSTEKQWELAKFLEKELKLIGMDEVILDENGYVMASLKSNLDFATKTVGFVAHMDTSDAMSGANVKPKVVKYTGEDIILNKDLDIKLTNKEFNNLNQYVNQELVVTDGTTLLGADDKAGIAEIVSAMEYLINHPEIKHGDIKVAFTPDEEIGKGADLFNVEKFAADFAYTMDGGVIGELQYENFNAAGATFKIKGISVHPGDSKNKMINAASIASEIAMMFPENETPETTEGYEGFYHLVNIQGDVENSTLHYIIREFDKDKFNERKQFVKDIANSINEKYSREVVTVKVDDQYYNMKEKLVDHMYIVDYARLAMEEIGVEPKIVPVRGGTDGSKLSYMGLLTPNIFTGGHNYHGRYEYIPVESMEKAVKVIIKICENVAK